VFSEILDSMPNLTHRTTWSEAQQMLLDNPRFTEDNELISEFVSMRLNLVQCVCSWLCVCGTETEKLKSLIKTPDNSSGD